MIVSGFLALAGAAASIIGGRKAQKGAERQGRLQAAYDLRAEGESARRQMDQQIVEQSSVAAQYAASGAEVGIGTPLNVMARQAAEYRDRRQRLAELGAERRKNIRLGAKLTGEQALWGSIGSAFGQAAQGAGYFYRR